MRIIIYRVCVRVVSELRERGKRARAHTQSEQHFMNGYVPAALRQDAMSANACGTVPSNINTDHLQQYKSGMRTTPIEKNCEYDISLT